MIDETGTPPDNKEQQDLAQLTEPNGLAVPSQADALDQNLDDTNPVETVLARPEWGSLTMAAMAASFDISVPIAMLVVNANEVINKNFNGVGSLTDGTMTLENYFKQKDGIVDEDGRKRENKDDDNLSVFADMVDDQREEQRREMEAWGRSEHRLGNVEMTGEEWAEFANELKKDGPLHDWLVEQVMRKENKTKAGAQTEATRIALLAQMQSTPKDHWTPEMKALDHDLEAHPDERARYTGYIDAAHDQRGKGFETANSLEQTSATTSRAVSIEARTDAFNAGDGSPTPNRVASTDKAYNATADFPTAPNLQAHHEAALAAIEPLDAPKPAVQIAAIPTPTIAPGSGFDV